MKTLTRSMVCHAHAIAREVGAKVILLHADVVEADSDLSALIQDVGFRVVLVSRRPGFRAPDEWKDLCKVVQLPDIAMTRTGQIKVAILLVAAERSIQAGDRILCLTGVDLSETLRHDHGPRHGNRDRTVLGLHRRPASRRRHADRIRTRLDTGW